MFQLKKGMKTLSTDNLNTLNSMWKDSVRDIILSTTLSKSGHPGGSLSSLHLLLTLYSMINHDPANPGLKDRDRVVMSMGHVSPAVYAVLSRFGYVDYENFLLEFRRAGSIFTGHVEKCVPGVEWNTGNLGQGLSVGCGMALAQKLNNINALTFVMMGDGEQQKGQISEAQRFAVKYKLNNLIGIVDRNRLQIGGQTDDVMPVNVSEIYKASGWNVIRIKNGHDFNSIYQVFDNIINKNVETPNRPTVIIADTIMGKGVSFMENQAKFHGSPLTYEMADKAFSELDIKEDIKGWDIKRKGHKITIHQGCPVSPPPSINPGAPRVYGNDQKTDCRSAYGNALADMAELNNKDDKPKIIGVSCDLEGSVKMNGFHKISPHAFFETGIQEHHAASFAGAISNNGFISFFSTFGAFAMDEVFNQLRLNDINQTNLKVVATHCGIDVGEDGPTHQCIDYVGLGTGILNFSVFIPADPNQTDHIIRKTAALNGNVFVGMGRSKMLPVLDKNGAPFFNEKYEFIPGKADWISVGAEGTIIANGNMVLKAIEATAILKDKYQLDIGVLNMGSLKPLDHNAVAKAAQTGVILTVEDHNIINGMGSLVANSLIENRLSPKFKKLGVTKYSGSGSPEELYKDQGLDPESIAISFMQLKV